MEEAVVDRLFRQSADEVGVNLTIDLDTQQVTLPDGALVDFEVDPFRRHCLLEGLDDIGITLQREDAITAVERDHQRTQPWLFNEVKL